MWWQLKWRKVWKRWDQDAEHITSLSPVHSQTQLHLGEAGHVAWEENTLRSSQTRDKRLSCISKRVHVGSVACRAAADRQIWEPSEAPWGRVEGIFLPPKPTWSYVYPHQTKTHGHIKHSLSLLYTHTEIKLTNIKATKPTPKWGNVCIWSHSS